MFRIIDNKPPPNIPEPYTEVSEYLINIKPRIIYCRYCIYSVVSSLPNPRCGQCRHEMVTVIRNDI